MPLLAALLALAASSIFPQELETAAGTPYSLDATLAKAPAVLVFWNSWLPESAEFVPLLREVEAAAAANGWPGAVVVFQDESDAWMAGIGSAGAALPRVLDRRGVLLRRFRVTRAPTVVLVGRDGSVLERSGPDATQVRALLESLGRLRQATR